MMAPDRFFNPRGSDMRNQHTTVKTLLCTMSVAAALLQAPSASALSTVQMTPDAWRAGRPELSTHRPDAWAEVVNDVPVTSAESAAVLQQSQCTFSGPSGTLPYPSGTITPVGNVVVRMKFAQTEAPPETQVLYAARHHQLAETGVSMAQQYRLHCEKPLASPIYATQTIRLRSDKSQGADLRDTQFVPFLQSLDRASLGKVKFDLNTMSCPFDVNVTLIAPYAENTVVESTARDPNRQEFLAWLRKLVFKFPERAERFLVGESTKVTVPCMVLDLT
jgi:hypothetical protein